MELNTMEIWQDSIPYITQMCTQIMSFFSVQLRVAEKGHQDTYFYC
jgi:hypothetical protein